MFRLPFCVIIFLRNETLIQEGGTAGELKRLSFEVVVQDPLSTAVMEL